MGKMKTVGDGTGFASIPTAEGSTSNAGKKPNNAGREGGPTESTGNRKTPLRGK